jgi:hypothetical protein
MMPCSMRSMMVANLPFILAVDAGAEDLGDLVGDESPQAELAATLEELVDGEVALEDEVTAILDLGDRIKA